MGTVVSIASAFKPFPKIARLARECVITEKLDGTNAQVLIAPADAHPDDTQAVACAAGHYIYAGSRSRWLQPGKATDNFGFAGWVYDHAKELVTLGPGRHFGEWWGKWIQRGYGLNERRFSLFNTSRWVSTHFAGTVKQGQQLAPNCCHVVPTLYRGNFSTYRISCVLDDLASIGSVAAPWYGDPEGIIIYHTAANQLFKRTIEGDEVPKTVAAKEAA